MPEATGEDRAKALQRAAWACTLTGALVYAVAPGRLSDHPLYGVVAAMALAMGALCFWRADNELVRAKSDKAMGRRLITPFVAAGLAVFMALATMGVFNR